MSHRSEKLKVDDFEGNSKWGQLAWDLLETIFEVWTGEGQCSYRFTTLRLVNRHWKRLADKLVKKIRPASTNSMENVGLLLDTMHEIRKVDLSWRRFDNDQAMGLARGLRSRESLIEVDMTGYDLPGITWLLEALGSCPNLECINCGFYGQADSAIEMLSDVLKNHSSLTKLELSWGHQSNQSNLGAQYLMSAIEKTSAPLRVLKLSGVDLSSKCGEDLGEALGSCKEQLQVVDISDNRSLMCAGLTPAFRRLGGCSRLEKLNFENCSGGDESIKTLANLISEIPNLKELKMARNRIMTYGAHHICRIIESAPNLTLLDISVNPLGETGCENLLESLGKNNGSLKTLICRFCYGMEEATKWNIGLGMSGLEALVVGYDFIRRSGVASLGAGLAASGTLKSLKLSLPLARVFSVDLLSGVPSLKKLHLEVMGGVDCQFLVTLLETVDLEELSFEANTIEGGFFFFFFFFFF
ncbi:hypothetical protein BSKO_05594 [Bryopsis sp. KO-2023]|nr:hypothetical protein BSKO_05594 [Bryopsis sp. KO-2023]